MNAYLLTVLIIDFDGLGADGAKANLEQGRFPNRCISPQVIALKAADIGEWTDDHQLNDSSTTTSEILDIFAEPSSTG